MRTLYMLPVRQSLQNAWDKVYGTKWTFTYALAIVSVVMLVSWLINALLTYFNLAPIAVVIQIIFEVFIALFSFGLINIGLERAKGNEVHLQYLYKPFQRDYVIKLLLAYLLVALISFGLILLLALTALISHLPIPLAGLLSLVGTIGAAILLIFILLRIGFAIPFILDKKIGPVDAVKLSYAATEGNVCRLLAIYVIATVIVAISAIPLGIGLIWTLPMLYILHGILYFDLQKNLLNSSVN